MKAAVSIPDNIFRSADTFAKRLGISRSELYATALAEFLSRRRSKQVTARLDAIYEEVDSALDHEITEIQSRSLPHENW
jgi:metal-responsive CopG/Arc/MetJ family transcriptional regulator